MVWRDLALRTRVARRILTLFLLSALAPLCAFAAVSSWMVTAELRRQTLSALRAEAKDVAMSATRSLQQVEGQLRVSANLLVGSNGELRERGQRSFDGSVVALLAHDSQGQSTTIYGELSMPLLSDEQRARLAADRAVLAIDPPAGDAARPTLTLVVPTGLGALIVARLDERVLWDLAEDSRRPGQTGLCVFDAGRHRLACSDDLRRAAPTMTVPSGSVAGQFQSASADGLRLSGFWSAPMAHQFSVPALTFLVTRPAADAEQPLVRFRRAFSVVVALTLAGVAWVTLRQIRRTLAPLSRLQDGAEQIRLGNFSARMDVASRDEFEALGVSFNLMVSEVQRQFSDLKALHLGTVEALARAIDAKSPWTAGHSQRVTALGVRIAVEMNLPAETIEQMRCGGLLHDIGKLGVPGRIVDKAGPLTAEEMAIMRQHPEMGARILEPVPQYAPIIPIVLEHHERFDGSGYPRGLAREAITLGGRIFAVADVVDAMSSDRPYRQALPLPDLVDYVLGQSGRMFDPAVVQAFLRVVAQGAPVPSARIAAGAGSYLRAPL